MANDFIRNAEGYYDPTAGTALEKVRRERAIMDIKAYDIIKTTRSNGSDKRFLILAITGIVATGLELRESYMPGAVSVICGAKFFAHPEKLEYIFLNTGELEYIRTATDSEISAVRAAVADVLGIKDDAPEESTTAHEVATQAVEIAEEQATELIRANTRAEVYRSLYESLLARVMKTA